MAAPRQPDYSKEELLGYLKSKHGLESDQDWVEEYGLTQSDVVEQIESILQKTEEDKDRMQHEMRLDADMRHRYDTTYFVETVDKTFKKDAEEKDIHHFEVRDTENKDAWIQYITSTYKS